MPKLVPIMLLLGAASLPWGSVSAEAACHPSERAAQEASLLSAPGDRIKRLQQDFPPVGCTASRFFNVMALSFFERDGVWEAEALEALQEGSNRVKALADTRPLTGDNLESLALRAMAEWQRINPESRHARNAKVRANDWAVLAKMRYNEHAPGSEPAWFLALFDEINGEMLNPDVDLMVAQFTLASTRGANAVAGPSFRIGFDYDSSELDAAGQRTLDRVAAGLRKMRDQGVIPERINIIGHTSTEGPAQYNQDLSVRRALAVRNALRESLPWLADRLSHQGRGATEPLYPDDNNNGLKQRSNRRVTFDVVGQ